MTDKTIEKLLDEAGISHEPSKIWGKRDLYKRDIYKPGGHFLGSFDAQEALEYIQHDQRKNKTETNQEGS